MILVQKKLIQVNTANSSIKGKDRFFPPPFSYRGDNCDFLFLHSTSSPFKRSRVCFKKKEFVPMEANSFPLE